MKAVAAAVSAGVFAISLALPSLLHAQDPEPPAVPPEGTPAEAPAEEASPPAEAPPPAPSEAPPAPDPASTEPATTPAPATPVAKASVTVSMVDYSFSPAGVTVAPGDTVTWVNNGQEDHTATGSGFDTGIVAPGASGSASFASPGSFPYVCSLHPNMKGTVTVSDTGGGTKTPEEDGGGTATDPGTGAPPGSEAAAAASPGAAGSADALPASGETEAPLLVLGAGLVACGALAAALARRRDAEIIR
jgi:plastocyanin